MTMISVSSDQDRDQSGDRLWVDDNGGDGPAVVLLHPGIHDSSVWEPVLPLLEGLRVVRFDQRGFGRSTTATTEFSTMGDLLAVLDTAAIDRAHLIGNSMGGAAALSLALEHPERVASLTLLAPGIEGYPWPETDDPDVLALEANFKRFKEAHDAEGIAGIFGRIFCEAGIDDSIHEQLLRSSQNDFDQEGLEQDNPEHWSRVDRLDVPVTVIVGGLDEPASTQAGADLAARVPGAVLIRIDEADHLISLRAPEIVAEAIRDTIARSR